jgi:Glycosyl hydrolase catalytic core
MSVERKRSFLLAAVFVAGCGSSSSPTDGTAAGHSPADGGTSALGGGASSGASSITAGNANAGNANAGAANVGGGSSSTGGTGNGGTTAAAGSAGSSGANAGAGAMAQGGGAGGGPSGTPFKGVANSPCAARTLLNVSWYYNWTQKETEACTDGKGGAFVPMIWGHPGAEQTAANIQTSIAGFVSKGYQFVLGFNEPDNSGQSNIPVASAISLAPSFDNPAIAVGTPATSANAAGQSWFKDYMGQVAANTTLREDFIAIHWYGWNAGSCDANASQLESYIKYAEGFPGNRPIWLTEWGCLNLSAPSTAEVVTFYKAALAVFANHPRLVRYAWYPWSPANCKLNNDDGTLTDLGQAYAAAPATK